MSSTDVTSYIDAIGQEWQADIARTLHARIHEAIPDVTERLQYGKPHYLKNGKYACVISPAKGWVALTIFNATNIDAPAGLFEPGPSAPQATIRPLILSRASLAVESAAVLRILRSHGKDSASGVYGRNQRRIATHVDSCRKPSTGPCGSACRGQESEDDHQS